MFDVLTVLTSTASGDAANTAALGTNTLIGQLVFIGFLVLFMYFVMFRPQRKADKQINEMRRNIQIGDEIITRGGIIGIVVRKTEDTLVIETGGDRNKIRIQLGAVVENITVREMLQASQAEKKPKKKESEGEEE